MKVPEHLKPQPGRFNLTPMIDVVFLLIIFFIVSNNFIQQDSAVSVELPYAETGLLPEERAATQLTITIAGSGTIYVGTQTVTLEQLRRIITLFRENSRKHGDEPTAVLIRADKTVLYGDIKPIMQIAAESGIVRVHFAVQP